MLEAVTVALVAINVVVGKLLGTKSYTDSILIGAKRVAGIALGIATLATVLELIAFPSHSLAITITHPINLGTLLTSSIWNAARLLINIAILQLSNTMLSVSYATASYMLVSLRRLIKEEMILPY